MPCYSVGGGKYRLGRKGPVYKDKETCERAYKAYLAKKHSGKKRHHSAEDGKFLTERLKKFNLL